MEANRFAEYEDDFRAVAEVAVEVDGVSQEEAEQAVGMFLVWLYQNRTLAA
jgi:hypothetical protein